MQHVCQHLQLLLQAVAPHGSVGTADAECATFQRCYNASSALCSIAKQGVHDLLCWLHATRRGHVSNSWSLEHGPSMFAGILESGSTQMSSAKRAA